MRLKSLYISHYKNLRNFSLSFDGSSFIDVFVGKNGTGKSNLFEALIEIFRHLDQLGSSDNAIKFEYKLVYDIDDQTIEIEWKDNKLSIGKDSDRKSLGKTPFPDSVLVYYSGHNPAVTSIIERYERSFRRRIKGANIDETRRFIGIGPGYKSLLLAVLLISPANAKARRFIEEKLSISEIGNEMDIRLNRPSFADGRLTDLGFEGVEAFDSRSHYWGADGITREFLDRLAGCIKGEFNHGNIYNAEKDNYSLTVNLELFTKAFEGDSATEIFRNFDNLKTLGMLADIEMELLLKNGEHANVSHFSDGQFQSVYIYSITELFKDRNCITLLDEPDSFLHPEWQFYFLQQVFEITEDAARTNHVLMSSHSASTIAHADEATINLFEFTGSSVVQEKVRRADVIKSLSAGLITFSEGEARLNIHHVLKNTIGPVLFTEGITDEMILETAWSKLFPGEGRMFEIQNAFSSGFMRNLMKDVSLYQNNEGRTFFSLFDFDEAYNDWKQLGDDVEVDPHKGLVKKHHAHECFALLLPVPRAGEIMKQVINPHTGGTYGNKALLTIELLFHSVSGLDEYFVVDTSRTDGFVKFVSDSKKVVFAKEVVPTLGVEAFEVFRPIFDFIKSKCSAP